MSTADPSSRVQKRPPLALIAGPTASGKSDLAVRLALDHGRATVINADSAQVYRDLRVLSARPSDQDLRGVEHRLFGAWDGAQPCSAAEWAAAARREVAAAHEAGKLPIMVGGTGLYLRTLLDGIAPVPAIDPTVRREVRALPQSEARAALEREDPATAARLAPADRARTGRALEVIRATGRGLGEWQEARVGGIASEVTLHPLILLPNRARLYERCDARLATMMDAGAVEEVVKLLARGLDPHLPVMRAIGVREIAGWLRGEWTREHAVSSAQAATRRYAKRQFTWLRHQLPVDWPRLGKQDYVDRAKLARLFRV
jgi:tRNA dimethylallyltransferase